MKGIWISMFVFLISLNITFAVEAEFYPMEVEPLEIAPGDTAVLNVTLKNLQPNYALYLKASLDPDDVTPIDPIGAANIWITKRAREAQESQQYFGAVLQGEEVTVSFPIYAKLGTSEDVYEVPLVLKWKNDQLEDVTQVIKIGILVRGKASLAIAGIETDPTEIRAGDDDVKVVVSIENYGKAEARNVRAKLLLTEPFKSSHSGSDEAFIGKLSPSESQGCAFYIDINETAKPGKYFIPMNISYEDERGEMHFERKVVELYLEPKPYFVVSGVEVEPKEVRPKDNVLLYIRVRNIGYEKAESVDLRVVREASQPFSFDTRSDYIGTLDPGEEGTAVLKFEVDKDATPKEYYLKIIVRCTGDSELGDTNVYTQSLKVPVEVEKGREEKERGIILAIVAGVIVVLVGIWRWKGRKRGGE